MTNHSNLIGTIDCFCAFNVQHFFGPDSDQLFYRNLNALLIPDGKAFLSAASFVQARRSTIYRSIIDFAHLECQFSKMLNN